jgi:ribonuclease HII
VTLPRTKRSTAVPSTAFERSLFAKGHLTVAGLDEVGRGAWAGPVSVGVAVITRERLRRLPRTVRDSKLLSAQAREALFSPLVVAVSAYAVGHASPEECDALGMTKAQALAAERAFETLPYRPDVIIVDGIHNYTGRSEVVTMVRADRHCRLVAAASVLAKVTRDRMMVEYAARFAGYGLERNKGYISLEHRRAVRLLGMTPIHRVSWSVGSCAEPDGDPTGLTEACGPDLRARPARL